VNPSKHVPTFRRRSWPQRFGLLRARALLRRMQSDRVLLVLPLVVFILFLAAMAALVSYSQQADLQRDKDNLQRDSEWAQQRISLDLTLAQDQVQAIANNLSLHEDRPGPFDVQALRLLRRYPQLFLVYYAHPDGTVVFKKGNPNLATEQIATLVGKTLKRANSQQLMQQALVSQRTAYSTPFKSADNGWLLETATPVMRNDQLAGVVGVVYSVDGILRNSVPEDLNASYAVSLLGPDNQLLDSASSQPIRDKALQYRAPLPPFEPGLVLQVSSYRSSPSWTTKGLYWSVFLLSALTLWTLLTSWNQLRQRLSAQEALTRETAFRRAIENSLSTGMQAVDMQGRIQYVNLSFCRMTGFEDSDLIGSQPPYPYWPAQQGAEMALAIQQSLDGLAPPSGFALKIRRKNGSEFDARVYVSPLIDVREKQTGWIMSVTDITEPTRIRQELAASHERFVAVLEGLDAAVSVISLGTEEPLFANKLYRQWFGASVHGHLMLNGGQMTSVADDDHVDTVDSFAGLPADEILDGHSNAHETHVEALDRWFDVRQRYMQWVDGRVAQLLIATDITPRKRAEETARKQEEKAQITSRLITMGEMASSLAHELNQPLTAISNYSSGMIARVKTHGMTQQELIDALEKTGRQAQRAAGVIKRVRDFVKKSEPARVSCRVQDIVRNTLELAEIELTRRNVRLLNFVAPGIPTLYADPILIEQVLLNLLRNAAESVDKAGRQGNLRSIELKIMSDAERVTFTVKDHGTGIDEAVMERLFEAFYTTKAEGLGIGLNICRSIIEYHQGRLWAENYYNQSVIAGCLFSFTLPLGAPKERPRPPAPSGDSAHPDFLPSRL
jgi:PAS domain S-box-containing protein